MDLRRNVESKLEKETVIPYDMGNHIMAIKPKAQGSSVTAARFKSIKGEWLKGERLRIDA